MITVNSNFKFSDYNDSCSGLKFITTTIYVPGCDLGDHDHEYEIQVTKLDNHNYILRSIKNYNHYEFEVIFGRKKSPGTLAKMYVPNPNDVKL